MPYLTWLAYLDPGSSDDSGLSVVAIVAIVVIAVLVIALLVSAIRFLWRKA